MQLDSGNSSSADLSHLDPAAEQLLAGKLHVADEEEDQELRIRGRNITQDLFSDLSSVASPHQRSIFSPPLQAEKSPQVKLTPPPAHTLPQSLLIDDLNLSESSGEDESESAEKVKVKNVTSSTLLEGQLDASEMNDVSRLELKAKLKNRMVQKKLKPVPYMPPGNSSSSEEEMVEEVEKPKDRTRSEQEDDLKMARKAGLKPGIIKKVLEAYCKFQTPINFQLVDKKLGSNDQWHVTLSDGKIKHLFVMSSKFDKVMLKIRDNTIICVNQIFNMKEKKSVAKQKMKVLLITNFYVPTTQQVNYDLIGLPKTFKL